MDGLDIIYADQYLREQGTVDFAEGDYTIGKNNSWQLKVPRDLEIKQDYYVMVEGEDLSEVTALANSLADAVRANAA